MRGHHWGLLHRLDYCQPGTAAALVAVGAGIVAAVLLVAVVVLCWRYCPMRCFVLALVLSYPS